MLHNSEKIRNQLTLFILIAVGRLAGTFRGQGAEILARALEKKLWLCVPPSNKQMYFQDFSVSITVLQNNGKQRRCEHTDGCVNICVARRDNKLQWRCSKNSGKFDF